MIHPAIHIDSEFLILELLRVRKSLTLEQVITLLPDELSRRGEIILLRRGFQYEVEWASARKPVLSCVG